jgi:hypothetical protein
VALLRLGDRSSTGLGASTRFFAALGATSAPGADYCFDEIVSKGTCKHLMRACGEVQECRGARPPALLLVRHGIVAKPSRERSSRETRRMPWRLLERRKGGGRRRPRQADAHRSSHSTTSPTGARPTASGQWKCRQQLARGGRLSAARGRLRAGLRRVSAHASDALAPGAKLGVSLRGAERRRSRSCSSRSSGAGVAPSSSRRRWRSCS